MKIYDEPIFPEEIQLKKDIEGNRYINVENFSERKKMLEEIAKNTISSDHQSSEISEEIIIPAKREYKISFFSLAKKENLSPQQLFSKMIEKYQSS